MSPEGNPGGLQVNELQFFIKGLPTVIPLQGISGKAKPETLVSGFALHLILREGLPVAVR